MDTNEELQKKLLAIDSDSLRSKATELDKSEEFDLEAANKKDNHALAKRFKEEIKESVPFICWVLKFFGCALVLMFIWVLFLYVKKIWGDAEKLEQFVVQVSSAVSAFIFGSFAAFIFKKN